jgi:hypothetical protein
MSVMVATSFSLSGGLNILVHTVQVVQETFQLLQSVPPDRESVVHIMVGGLLDILLFPCRSSQKCKKVITPSPGPTQLPAVPDISCSHKLFITYCPTLGFPDLLSIICSHPASYQPIILLSPICTKILFSSIPCNVHLP